MNKIPDKYIPLDKSWLIRLGMLDLLHGYRDIKKFLIYHRLSKDLKAMLAVSTAWQTNNSMYVGESATLYRCVRYNLWKKDEKRDIRYGGTLKERIEKGKISNDPDIINLSLNELLKL